DEWLKNKRQCIMIYASLLKPQLSSAIKQKLI
ncbi:MAG: hypothetical protein ACI9FJ_000816, partial [Alteromonadaceae bacterium]